MKPPADVKPPEECVLWTSSGYVPMVERAPMQAQIDALTAQLGEAVGLLRGIMSSAPLTAHPRDISAFLAKIGGAQ